jgi:hypothetical protein
MLAEISPNIVTSLYKIYINIYRKLLSFIDEEMLAEISLDSANTALVGDCAITTPSSKNSCMMKLINEQRKAKCARERERYARMTPEQREAKFAHQKIHDCQT